MSDARWEVIGDDKVIQKLLRKANSEEEFDKLAENAMKRIQLGAFKRAPEDTGFLKSNLIADENRMRPPDVKSGVFDLIDGTEYTIVQEYEHRSNSAFIRDSVWEEEPKFVREVEKLAKDGKW